MPTVREENQDLVKIVGQRMKVARDLNNMSLSYAANRLGYQTPSKLSKIENASDTMSVPVKTIVRAAKLYIVSADYLLGLVDDWDETMASSSERMASMWMMDAWDAARAKDVKAIREAMIQVRKLNEVMDMLGLSGKKTQEAFDAFVQNNPEFEDMKSSNRLMTSIDSLKKALELSNFHINKLKFSPARKESSAGLQIHLFDEVVH